MVGQCHQSNQHESGPTPGGSGRQEGLACSGPWGHEESDTTKRTNDVHFSNITNEYMFNLLRQEQVSLPGKGQPSTTQEKVSHTVQLYFVNVGQFSLWLVGRKYSNQWWANIGQKMDVPYTYEHLFSHVHIETPSAFAKEAEGVEQLRIAWD